MSKIIRVIVEYDDKTYIAEGNEAEEWKKKVDGMEGLYFAHFGTWETKWTRIEEKKE